MLSLRDLLGGHEECCDTVEMIIVFHLYSTAHFWLYLCGSWRTNLRICIYLFTLFLWHGSSTLPLNFYEPSISSQPFLSAIMFLPWNYFDPVLKPLKSSPKLNLPCSKLWVYALCVTEKKAQ